MRPQEIHYYVNTDKESPMYGKEDPALGIVIDWKMIHKALLKTGKCRFYPDPLKADISKVGYIVDISDRSRGKTTQKLVLGLLLYVAYGIELQLIRQNSRMIEPKLMKNMYKTVIEEHLIEEITEGRWNHIYYWGKRWYLCLTDEDGKIIETDTGHCTFCCGLDESYDLKSTYNAPRGDMIFFDEFIGNSYGYDDFTNFIDICKTIIRDRQSPIVYMSSNTIDLNSQWFDEFGCRREVEGMRYGDYKVLSTDIGTHMYIELLYPDESEKRKKVNTRFFGFDNPKLNAISGRGEWATDVYPHIPKRAGEMTVINNQVYLRYQGNDIHLTLCEDQERGLCVLVTPATRTHDDSIILMAEEPTSRNHLFGFGKGTVVDIWWRLYYQNRWLYTTNGMGATIHSYVGYVKSKIDKLEGY